MRKRYFILFAMLAIAIAPSMSSGLHEERDYPEYLEIEIPSIEDAVIDGIVTQSESECFKAVLITETLGEVKEKDDLAADCYFGWTEEGLYLSFAIRDDSPDEHENPRQIWKKDSITIFISDFPISKREIFMVSPGISESMNQNRIINFFGKNLQGVRSSSSATDFGYVTEVLIPFDALAVEGNIADELAMQIWIGDSDDSGNKQNRGLKWFWGEDSYTKPQQSYVVRLSGTRSPDMNYSVKAFAVDEDAVHYKVFADAGFANETISFYEKSNLVYKTELTMRGEYLEGEFIRSYHEIEDGTYPLYVYSEDRLLDIIYPQEIYRHYIVDDSNFFATRNASSPYALDMKKFAIQLKKNPGLSGSVMFLGSSSIRRWTSLEQDMTPYSVCNRGFGGSTVNDVLFYFDDLIPPVAPSAIVFYEGDNDLYNEPEILLDDFIESTRLFYEKVHAILPDTTIIQLSIKDSITRHDKWESRYMPANEKLKAMAAEYDFVRYIDLVDAMLDENGDVDGTLFVEDGLHLNEKGYQIWTGVIKPAISGLVISGQESKQ